MEGETNGLSRGDGEERMDGGDQSGINKRLSVFGWDQVAAVGCEMSGVFGPYTSTHVVATHTRPSRLIIGFSDNVTATRMERLYSTCARLNATLARPTTGDCCRRNGIRETSTGPCRLFYTVISS